MFTTPRANTELILMTLSTPPSTPSSSATWTRDSPARQLRLGFDAAGRLLEVVVGFDEGNELLIHAMRARRQYLDLLD